MVKVREKEVNETDEMLNRWVLLKKKIRLAADFN
jgi:hypothetical protein